MGPKSKMVSLQEHRRGTDIEADRGGGHVKTEAETRVMQLGAKGPAKIASKHQKLARSREGSSLRAF